MPFMSIKEFVEASKEREFDVNIDGYDFKVLESNIIAGDDDIRSDEKYIATAGAFLEVVLACSVAETAKWLKRFMRNGIVYGKSTKDRDWRFYFLVAYDLYNEMC